MKNSKFIGMINLKDKIIVSDPYFAVGTKNQGNIDNIVPGTYNCFILKEKDANWGIKVNELFITNSDRPISRDQINTLADFEIRVDSGTAGIFDYDYYVKYHKDQHDDVYKVWYNKYVLKDYLDYRITANSGVWSISEYGDGIHDNCLHKCYIHSDSSGSIDAIRLVFIDDSNKD